MNKIVLAVLLFIICENSSAQINLEDSTVQVIGYWDKNEKQSYTVTTEKYKVNGTDTTGREFSSYDVEITIKDSSAKSYTIEWFYKNCKTNSESKIMQKLAQISQDMGIVIKTDEMGTFTEIVNWKEVRDYIYKSLDKLKVDFKEVPKMDEIISQTKKMFSTKEAIESSAIKEIQQFYTFHGGKYKLGEEISAKSKFPNIYGGEPFDGELTVKLDEINFEDGNSIFRMWQTIDQGQLVDATFDYMTKLAKTMGTTPPTKSDMPTINNEVRNASRIHSGSGWPIYSVETKEVTTDSTLNFEERVIELK